MLNYSVCVAFRPEVSTDCNWRWWHHLELPLPLRHTLTYTHIHTRARATTRPSTHTCWADAGL